RCPPAPLQALRRSSRRTPAAVALRRRAGTRRRGRRRRRRRGRSRGRRGRRRTVRRAAAGAAAAGARTGRRSAVGAVEARTLEDDSDRGVDLPQRALTLRADRQGVVGELLNDLKTLTALGALVLVR